MFRLCLRQTRRLALRSYANDIGPAAPGAFQADRKLKIAIIGQEQFGASVYRRLRRDGHEIVGVFTKPDKGKKKDPLAAAALEDGVQLIQPKSWQRKGVVNESVFEEYASLGADLNVMAYVSQLIPTRVLEHPPMRTIQYHPSVLPKRRGRSAINQSIVNGDDVIGLSIFYPDEGLDTGPLLLQRARPLKPNDTVMTAYQDFLFPEGIEAISTAVKMVAANMAPSFPQDHSAATYEGPWEGDIAKIDWSAPVKTVHNIIRGSDPAPGAWSYIDGQKMRVFGSRIVDENWQARLGSQLGTVPVGENGELTAKVYQKGLVIPCTDGDVSVEKLGLESGRSIQACDVLRLSELQAAKRELTPAQLELKEKIASVFTDTLGCSRDDVGDSQSFFELGGGSMEAIQLVGNLMEELDMDGALANDAAYMHPSLEDMVEHIIQIQEGGSKTGEPLAPDHAVSRYKAGKLDLRFPTKMLINGEWVSSEGGVLVDNINPSTEEPICQLYEGTEADVDKAVAAARAAFDQWANMNARDRGNILLRLADLMDKHEDELAALESVDSGIPITLAKKTHIGMSKEVLRYFGGWADKIQGKTIPIPHPGPGTKHLTFTKHHPVGVVGAIIPWNFPSMMFAWKLGPALACGNTVVLKPALDTSLTALRLGEMLQEECGLPKGVLNIVTGSGNLGAHLNVHPQVDKIGFTGSTAVGKAIMEKGAFSLKRVTLELGGKSPLVVFADCNLQAAVKAAHSASFFNMGQNCCAGARVYVQDEIYEEFVEEIVRMCEKTRVGDPLDRRTEQGPQNHKKHFEKILGLCDIGVKEGCNLVFGGKQRGDKGFFIGPTVFRDCEDHHTIVKEEIFGPVMSILKFDGDVDDVIRRANSTDYGLAAGVFTSDITKAMTVADNVLAGTVWINTYNVTDAAAPFGGFKESGIGRDLGEYALHSYTEIKAYTVSY
eukprot:m.264078 g.264078  ORF g.264078 m.264078 type:complete len:945 (+) comp27460_c0_seq1:139-2973(+)